MTLALSDQSASENPQMADVRRRLSAIPHTITVLEDQKDHQRVYRFITAEDTIIVCAMRLVNTGAWPDPRITLSQAADANLFLAETRLRQAHDTEAYGTLNQCEYQILIRPHPKSVTPAPLRTYISEPISYWIAQNPF